MAFFDVGEQQAEKVGCRKPAERATRSLLANPTVSQFSVHIHYVQRASLTRHTSSQEMTRLVASSSFSGRPQH